MKKLTYSILFALAVAATLALLNGCFDPVPKNHPPFEPTTVQTSEQKEVLMKMVNEAEANYKANKHAH